MHETPDTPARKALAAWLATKGKNQTDLGELIGVSPSTVNRWLTKSSRPSADQRAKIEALTGVPASDWNTVDERRVAAKALAALRTAS